MSDATEAKRLVFVYIRKARDLPGARREAGTSDRAVESEGT